MAPSRHVDRRELGDSCTGPQAGEGHLHGLHGEAEVLSALPSPGGADVATASLSQKAFNQQAKPQPMSIEAE